MDTQTPISPVWAMDDLLEQDMTYTVLDTFTKAIGLASLQ